MADLGLKREQLVEKKSIEVGNIFTLGTRFSVPLGLTFKNEEGSESPVIMGCYGIGPARVMGTIAEILSDDRGLIWPEVIAPFRYHLVSLGHAGDEVSKVVDELYADLTSHGVEVLYDDRDARAGEKFADSDLLGLPYRIVVGKDAVASGQFEVINRATGAVEKKSHAEILQS